MSKQEKLNEIERSTLEGEYRELCHDWWQRDKNVLDKLPAAGILFGLLGVAVAYISPTLWLIKLALLSIGSLYSMVLSISIAKDIYLRDGTEKLLRRLSDRLGLNNLLQSLKSDSDNGLNLQELQFPRKIRIQRDKSTLKLWGPTALQVRLKNWLLNQVTFRWILAFYLLSFSFFGTLIVLILIKQKFGCNLPI